MPIRTPDQRLRVFVSSTLHELAGERRAVSRSISALGLTPVMFELGARPHPPRDLYRAYVAQSDIFLGLYWQRYGELVPGTDISGLEDEFQLSQALPRLLYVKAPAPGRQPRLDQLLAQIEREASYRTFHTPTELGRAVREDLATLLSERFAAGGPAPSPEARSPGRRRRRPLPCPATSLVGREGVIDELAALVARPGVRLVTLTGPSGIGKTRLAIAVGERLGDGSAGDMAFVPLASTTRPDQVVVRIARAAGFDLTAGDAPLEAVIDCLGDDPWLLVLDNLEQVLDAGHDLDGLLAGCPAVTILATSLTPLRLRAEREFEVPPLPLPRQSGTTAVAELASSPAVALFVDRARAVRHDFALSAENAPSVATICRRLEGVPLAIELAAARTRLLDPESLLRRLGRSLDALGTGSADLPERQQTLRATVEWSVGLLDDAERSLLETAAVFVDGWTLDAAADVAAVDEDRALALSEALARHSLISIEMTDQGARSRMLETLRGFVAEGLARRPDAMDIHRRHADHYRRLAERADRPLRDLRHDAWAARLRAEAGNLGAAVQWYLAEDHAPLPHMFRVLAPFRVLWPFWGLRETIMGDGRFWIDALLPDAGALEPHARAELLWTAAVIAVEASDEPAALAARTRLTALLDHIDDRYLQAVCELAVAWISALAAEVDRALDEASRSVCHLRQQDEPLWTVLALITLGELETATGRYDDADDHLSEVRDFAARFDVPWVAATSLLSLATLALARGRVDEAWPLLDEALALSLAMHSTHSLTNCLSAFARLTLADGDAEGAALLAGAADGLRHRAGLRVWTALRRDRELVHDIRQVLGAKRFDAVFAAGSRLPQPEAVAAVGAHRRTGTRVT